ncbi:hypothetical protein M8J76_001497 [Diaphorina citri]|nr:hypothetical protein M8J76_001497 [Diaphorina citri]
MNNDTSPVSIRKRKPRMKQLKDTSSADHPQCSNDILAQNEKPSGQTNAPETPIRKNSQLCESPQFLDLADSPEFRVGWDDGFGQTKSCDQIKLNENINGSRKKSNRKTMNVRTLRTQRILSTNVQPETITCVNDHPESDEFLQWAQSLLCAPPDVEQEEARNSSLLNQSLNTSSEQQSPKPTEMRTPKRPVFKNSTPSSDNIRETRLFQSIKKRSYPSVSTNQKSPCSPLARQNQLSSKPLPNEKCTRNQMKPPGQLNTNANNNLDSKDEYNEFFNDSVNELMIQCSQAVESRFNNENSNVANLLDDSSNDLILQCTQQVENDLLKLEKQNSHQNIPSKIQNSEKTKGHLVNTNVSDRHVKKADSISNRQNNQPKEQPSRNETADVRSENNSKFIPKQSSHLHKLDCPSAIVFNNESNNVISSISNKLIGKGFNTDVCSSPNQSSANSRSTVLEGTEKSSNKHVLSPTAKDDTRRKKFCHNNNVVSASIKCDKSGLTSNQDLTSILNEDDDVLSNLDMDEVLSQIPSIQPSKPCEKPNTSNIVHQEKTSSVNGQRKDGENRNSNFNGFKPKIPTSYMQRKDAESGTTISFNGLKPNPVISTVNKPIQVQKTVPIVAMPDVIPKYTQEQIQMKKIEAKRRLALKIRRQKSFEMK